MPVIYGLAALPIGAEAHVSVCPVLCHWELACYRPIAGASLFNLIHDSVYNNMALCMVCLHMYIMSISGQLLVSLHAASFCHLVVTNWCIPLGI